MGLVSPQDYPPRHLRESGPDSVLWNLWTELNHFEMNLSDMAGTVVSHKFEDKSFYGISDFDHLYEIITLFFSVYRTHRLLFISAHSFKLFFLPCFIK